MIQKFTLSKILSQYSDFSPSQKGGVCLGCKQAFEVVKDKTQIKQYQQVKIFSLDLDADTNQLTLFLEDENVG